MDRLSTVLPRVLGRRGFAVQAQAALVTFKARTWLQEYCPHLTAMVEVRMLKEGELVISCAHSIALQEVQSVSEDVLQFVRRECPLVPIAGLRVIRS